MSTTTDQPYAGAFREWWLRRSFYAKNFLILDAIALFVLMIALVATSVGGSDSDFDESTGTLPSSYNSPSQYLSDVRTGVAGTGQYSNAQLLSFGYNACQAQRQGEGSEWVSYWVASGTMDYDAAYTVQQSALGNLCVEVPL
jgi:hypothetical protein